MLLPILLAAAAAGPAHADPAPPPAPAPVVLPVARPLVEPGIRAAARLGWAQDLTPPRWTTPRDRTTLGGELTWRPDPRVGADLRVDGLRADRYPDGGQVRGAGDVRLGAEGRLLLDAPVQLDLRAEVKLPNADDRRELGTDETDLALLVGLHRARGRLAARLRGGLDLLGDPHRVGARVAVPRLDADVAVAAGPAALGAAAALRLPAAAGSAPDEPIRSRVHLLARVPCPVLLEARAGLGLAPASPAWLAGLTVGWQAGCRTPPLSTAD